MNPETRGADSERETVVLEIHDLEIEAELWQGMAGWNASTLIEGRDFRVMGAANREDALTRLKSNLLSNVEATSALGVKIAATGRPTLTGRANSLALVAWPRDLEAVGGRPLRRPRRVEPAGFVAGHEQLGTQPDLVDAGA